MANNRYDRMPPSQDGSNYNNNQDEWSRYSRYTNRDPYNNQDPYSAYSVDPSQSARQSNSPTKRRPASRNATTNQASNQEASQYPSYENAQNRQRYSGSPNSQYGQRYAGASGGQQYGRPSQQQYDQRYAGASSRQQYGQQYDQRYAGSPYGQYDQSPYQQQPYVADERYQRAYENRAANPANGTSAYRNYENYRNNTNKRKRNPKRLLISLGVTVVVIAVIVVGIVAYVNSLPITITLNGNKVELQDDKTIGGAIQVLEQSGVVLQPGDFVAVDGSVLEAGEGKPFTATVNDESTEDTEQKLDNGDVVELSNGGPIEEDYDAAEQAIPYETEIEGYGAIRVIEGEGTDGVLTTKTGKVSGITVDEVTTEPSNIVCKQVTPQVGSDKVIALTFDDGPWYTTTAEILDILKQYDVKATFFTVGNCIDEDRAYLVQREYDEGHQVATHTWDHADGSGNGVDLTLMSPEEQVEEIQKGYEAIEAVTGVEPNKIVRFPGGNMDAELIETVHSYVDADIFWNIDTLDWSIPGVDAIVSEIESVQPGEIVLMHDGGGDREETVEALKEALPYLVSQGFKFVTIDELMEYPLE